MNKDEKPASMLKEIDLAGLKASHAEANRWGADHGKLENRQPRRLDKLIFHNSQLHLSSVPYVSFMKAEAVKKSIKEYLSSKEMATLVSKDVSINKTPRIIKQTAAYHKKHKTFVNGCTDNKKDRKSKKIATDIEYKCQNDYFDEM